MSKLLLLWSEKAHITIGLPPHSPDDAEGTTPWLRLVQCFHVLCTEQRTNDFQAFILVVILLNRGHLESRYDMKRTPGEKVYRLADIPAAVV